MSHQHEAGVSTRQLNHVEYQKIGFLFKIIYVTKIKVTYWSQIIGLQHPSLCLPSFIHHSSPVGPYQISFGTYIFAFIAKIILLTWQGLCLLWVEVSNQQVVVWRLTSEWDMITDSPPSLFHLELAGSRWLTALFLIIHPALGVWRSGDHLLGRWGEVALSSNIHWPAVLPIHSQNTQSPALNTAQIRTQKLKLNSNGSAIVVFGIQGKVMMKGYVLRVWVWGVFALLTYGLWVSQQM